MLTNIYIRTYMHKKPISGLAGVRVLDKNKPIKCLNSKFSFPTTGRHSKVKETRRPDYLPWDEERIVRFISFSRVFAQCEMQTASSFRI